MSIALTANTTADGGAGATIWNTLEASVATGSPAAQMLAALTAGSGTAAGAVANGAGALGGALTPVIASAQATLDSIMANPALNLSRVLTSPSFAALVSTLNGSANGTNDAGSGNRYSTAYSTTIGSGGENSSAGTTSGSDSGATATSVDGSYFSRLLGELESVMQTPTGGNAAESLLGRLSSVKLAVA